MDYRNLFVGVDNRVMLEDGKTLIPVNFDNGATTPPFRAAVNAISHDLNCYAAIGRSKGQKNSYCTKKFNVARDDILDFFHLEPNKDHSVVYVKSATEGLNLLANILLNNNSGMVLTTRMEHHANLLPWRYNASKMSYVEVDDKGRIHPEDIEAKLKLFQGKIKIVAVTAASNVTGYVNDINEIARIAHKYHAKIVVDGAQIVAHRELNLKGNSPAETVDFFVFSAHKVYAPFGGGVVIGLKSVLSIMEPFLKGGGAVHQVFDYTQTWLDTPERMEAGTQNYFGVISMAAALKEIHRVGFSQLVEHENQIKDYLIKNLLKMPNITLYGDTKETEDRLGVIVFNIKSKSHDEVAEALAKKSAIATRQGKFCAHPYVTRLLGISNLPNNKEEQDQCGMVRLSLGLYNTIAEADKALACIRELAFESKTDTKSR